MNTIHMGQEFRFHDGRSANTISDLITHIKELSPDEYNEYVNEWKNDFFNWVNDCISQEIAAAIQGNIKQKDMIALLTGHEWHYHHRKKHNY